MGEGGASWWSMASLVILPIRLAVYIGSLVAAWTIAVTLSLGFSGYRESRATHELALGRAE